MLARERVAGPSVAELEQESRHHNNMHILLKQERALFLALFPLQFAIKAV